MPITVTHYRARGPANVDWLLQCPMTGQEQGDVASDDHSASGTVYVDQVPKLRGDIPFPVREAVDV